MSTQPKFLRHDIKVVLAENIHASAVELLRAEGYEVEHLTGALAGDELLARLAGAHLVGIRSKTQLRRNE